MKKIKDLSYEKKLEIVKGLFISQNEKLPSTQNLEKAIHHIDTHKYFIGIEFHKQYTFSAAAHSWFETVYTPIQKFAHIWLYRRLLSSIDVRNLYFYISPFYYNLKKRTPSISYKEAILRYFDLILRHGSSIFSKIIRKLLEII